MCLYSWTSRKKAISDIICYKVFICDTEGRNLSSRYRRSYKWQMGKLTEAERAKAGSVKKESEIRSGYFHSYQKVRDALTSPELYLTQTKVVVCKCIIPAGSYYYYGIHSDGKEGYASKKLIIDSYIYKN